MIARARATKRPHSHKRLRVDEGRRRASDKTTRAPEPPLGHTAMTAFAHPPVPSSAALASLTSANDDDDVDVDPDATGYASDEHLDANVSTTDPPD
jgi:hypothetical protein